MNDTRINMPKHMDTDTLMSVVVMAQEADALERDALGLEPVVGLAQPDSAWVGYPESMKHGLQFVATGSSLSGFLSGSSNGFSTGGTPKVRKPLAWHAKVAGVAAAAAVALGIGQMLWTNYASDPRPTNTSRQLAKANGNGFADVNSFVHADAAQAAQDRLGWLRPTSISVPREFAAGYGNRSGIRLTPLDLQVGSGTNTLDGDVVLTGAREEERSMVLAVFRDSSASGCDCVRVQSGVICGGQELNDIDREDLLSAAMEGQCMNGAESVSVFALSGPMALLPKTREEAEALAIMLADLPWECLMNDPCVQHMVSACLPGGVSLVSKTLALN